MGMAASQARYLGLTARKTNVEYEGQQINQARTALANQSADTFNQLLGLTVPVAPDKNKFISIQYSYVDGTNGETVSNMSEIIDDPDGYNYMVTHYHWADLYKGIESMRTNPQVVTGLATVELDVPAASINKDTGTGVYSKDGEDYTVYDPAVAEQKNIWEQIKNQYSLTTSDVDVRVWADPADPNVLQFATVQDLETAYVNRTNPDALPMPTYYIKPETPTYVGNSQVKLYDPTDETLKSAYEQIVKDWPDSEFAQSPASDVYYWTNSLDGKTYFACANDLAASAASAADPAYPTENQQVKLLQYNAQNVKSKIERTEKAFVDIDGSGRAESIRYENSSAVFSLHTEQITDEIAYENAMNKYTYDVRVYEKTIEDINAKTKKIQEQDRTLELRLKQLDTEQEALQTEMEAVKKVIDKNIEQTFKTFE
jgi:hypothetical protein